MPCVLLSLLTITLGGVTQEPSRVKLSGVFYILTARVVCNDVFAVRLP